MSTKRKNIGHKLDVELRTLLANYIEGLRNIGLKGNNLQRSYLPLEERIMSYCTSNKIDLKNSTNYIFVSSSAGMDYLYFLSLKLVFCPIYLITPLLNHHRKNYTYDRINFVDIVVNTILELVDRNGPFDNSERLNKISEWCDVHQRSLKTDQKMPEVLDFTWDPKRISFLKKLSKEIKVNGYTNRVDDLQKVFLENKIVIWNDSPHSLTYLIYKLYKIDKPFFKVKRKAYLSKAQDHFEFYDGRSPVVKRNDLRSILNYVIKRKRDDHVELRNTIDSIINSIKKTLPTS